MEGNIAHFFKTYTLHQNYHVYSDRKFMPSLSLKLANTFVLALVEEMLNPLNSL